MAQCVNDWRKEITDELPSIRRDIDGGRHLLARHLYSKRMDNENALGTVIHYGSDWGFYWCCALFVE